MFVKHKGFKISYGIKEKTNISNQYEFKLHMTHDTNRFTNIYTTRYFITAQHFSFNLHTI